MEGELCHSYYLVQCYYSAQFNFQQVCNLSHNCVVVGLLHSFVCSVIVCLTLSCFVYLRQPHHGASRLVLCGVFMVQPEEQTFTWTHFVGFITKQLILDLYGALYHFKL